MNYWFLKKKVFRDISACHALFIYSSISQEKDKGKVPKIYVKHVIGNLFLLFEVITREQVDTQGMLTREHMSK